MTLKERVLRLLTERREVGLTCLEVEEMLNLGHGPASSVLSRLHEQRRVSMLTEQREGNRVYVAVGFVNERPVMPRHGGVLTDTERTFVWRALKAAIDRAEEFEEEQLRSAGMKILGADRGQF